MLYGNTLWCYWRVYMQFQGIYPICLYSYPYIYIRIQQGNFICVSVLTRPYKWRKTKTWIQHKNKIDWGRLRECSNDNHPFHLRVMNKVSQLTRTRGKTPSPRSTEIIILETSQSQSPKPRPTFRASELNWKAISLTLGQYHQKNSPKNEGTGAIPQRNIQLNLPASHYEWNPGHLTWPRYSYHPWIGH